MARSLESDANDNNMVKRDQSATSDTCSTERVPPYTHLGRIPVPIVSSCQGLLLELEKFRGDIPFMSEIISRSSVDFTDNQLTMVTDVVEGALIESQYGIDRMFYAALTTLRESLQTRIKDEEKFYAAQKKRYTAIYEIVRQSSFPFSAKQAACLYRMLTALYHLTGHPNAAADEEFKNALRDLIRLLDSDDHVSDATPHRFFVTHTLHYYLHEMLMKVNELAKEEAERIHPDFIHPHSEIDLASYLAISLEVVITKSKVLSPREHFHYGMIEVYTKLVDIFRKSGLDFNNRQEIVLEKVEKNIMMLQKEPLVRNHHRIVEAVIEFMSKIEENNPIREIKLEDAELVWDEEGKVNNAVREIGWGLVYLQPVATEHLRNFSTFGNGVENVIARLMERFLELYPLH